MTKSLAELIADADGTLTLRTLLARFDAEEQETPTRRESRAKRVAAWTGTADTLPIDKVVDLDDTMKRFVDERFAKVQTDEPTILTDEQFHLLAEELVDAEKITEAMNARHAQVRRMFFEHADLVLAKEGLPAGGDFRVDVDDLDRQFHRSGGGPGAPSLNVEVLRENMDAEDFAAVTDRSESLTITDPSVIKALLDLQPSLADRVQVTETLDEDRLSRLLATKPDLVETAVRPALVPGVDRTPRFSFKQKPKGKPKK